MSALRFAFAPVAMLVLLGVTTPDARVRSSPLYPILVQYDREIRTLQATERVPGIAGVSSEIARDAAASSHLAAPDFEREASDVGGKIERALDARVQRAYADRRAQFLEAESTRAYDLERADEPSLAPLRAKLDLQLDAPTRTRLKARVNAILASEDAKMAALRASDDAALERYRASTIAAARADGTTAISKAQAAIAGDQRTLRAVSLSPAAYDARANAIDASLRATQAEVRALQRARAALYAEILRT